MGRKSFYRQNPAIDGPSTNSRTHRLRESLESFTHPQTSQPTRRRPRTSPDHERRIQQHQHRKHFPMGNRRPDPAKRTFNSTLQNLWRHTRNTALRIQKAIWHLYARKTTRTRLANHKRIHKIPPRTPRSQKPTTNPKARIHMNDLSQILQTQNAFYDKMTTQLAWIISVQIILGLGFTLLILWCLVTLTKATQHFLNAKTQKTLKEIQLLEEPAHLIYRQPPAAAPLDSTAKSVARTDADKYGPR